MCSILLNLISYEELDYRPSSDLFSILQYNKLKQHTKIGPVLSSLAFHT